LGVAGGLTDLSDVELQTLLGDLTTGNGAAAADTSFDEPDAVIPSVGADADQESI
jgi:hypothetical protein